MFRLMFVGIVISAFLGEGNIINTSPEDNKISYNMNENIDPIVVGHAISDAHKQVWKNNNDKYHECGLCGEEAQAFPGD